MGLFSRLFSPKTYCQPPYDFFVSYKSQDVGIVRQIAEQLIAGGVSIWFAEYKMLFSVLSGWSNSKLEQAINNGIQQAKFGICFTNDRYIQSKWCRKELEQLLGRTSLEPYKMIEIKLPAESLAHQLCPGLAQSSSTEYRSVEQTMRYIRDVSKLPIEIVDSTTLSLRIPSIFHYNNKAYSIDLAEWEVDNKESSTPDRDGNIAGPKFRRWFEQDLVWGHLIVGRQDIHILREQLKEGVDDDWEYYKKAISFAEMFYGKIWMQQCVGVHMLYMHGFRHNAYTTFALGMWSRLYSVVLPNPNGHGDIEFAFFFFFCGKFTEFCRYAHYMDKVVQSLSGEGF